MKRYNPGAPYRYRVRCAAALCGWTGYRVGWHSDDPQSKPCPACGCRDLRVTFDRQRRV